jgi:hemerythrin-like metal-binding protein
MRHSRLPQEQRTGIDDLDLSRALLFQWFHRAFPEGKEPRAPMTSQAMDFLLEYSRTPFDDELFAMRLFGFPDVKAHAREHEALRETIGALHRRSQAEGVTPRIQEAIRGMLLQLVSSHTARADLQFARFLKEQHPAIDPTDDFPQRRSASDAWGIDRDEARNVGLIPTIDWTSSTRTTRRAG